MFKDVSWFIHDHLLRSRPLATAALLIALVPFVLANSAAQAQGHGGMSMPMGSSQLEGEKPSSVGTANAVTSSERKLSVTAVLRPLP